MNRMFALVFLFPAIAVAGTTVHPEYNVRENKVFVSEASELAGAYIVARKDPIYFDIFNNSEGSFKDAFKISAFKGLISENAEIAPIAFNGDKNIRRHFGPGHILKVSLQIKKAVQAGINNISNCAGSGAMPDGAEANFVKLSADQIKQALLDTLPSLSTQPTSDELRMASDESILNMPRMTEYAFRNFMIRIVDISPEYSPDFNRYFTNELHYQPKLKASVMPEFFINDVNGRINKFQYRLNANVRIGRLLYNFNKVFIECSL